MATDAARPAVPENNDPYSYYVFCESCGRREERNEAWTIDEDKGLFECRWCGADEPGGEFALCPCGEEYERRCSCPLSQPLDESGE